MTEDLQKQLERAKRELARRNDDHARLVEAYNALRNRTATSSDAGQNVEGRATVERYEVADFPYPREWELEDAELKRERDEAQAEAAAMYEALGLYGEHRKGCSIGPCDCGYLEAMSRSKNANAFLDRLRRAEKTAEIAERDMNTLLPQARRECDEARESSQKALTQLDELRRERDELRRQLDESDTDAQHRAERYASEKHKAERQCHIAAARVKELEAEVGRLKALLPTLNENIDTIGTGQASLPEFLDRTDAKYGPMLKRLAGIQAENERLKREWGEDLPLTIAGHRVVDSLAREYATKAEVRELAQTSHELAHLLHSLLSGWHKYVTWPDGTSLLFCHLMYRFINKASGKLAGEEAGDEA